MRLQRQKINDMNLVKVNFTNNYINLFIDGLNIDKR